MKTIDLKEYGTFLTGRSRAFNAVQSIQIEPRDTVRVSFAGIRSTAQSFVSELLVSLHKRGVDLSTVEFVDYENDHVKKRVEKEMVRLKKIFSS